MTDEVNRFNASLRLEHECKINLFAFRDVEAMRWKIPPGLGTIAKKRLNKRSGHNDETRAGPGHKIDCVLFVKPCEKALHATAKIPDHAWFLEFDGRKLHVRLQMWARFPEKLIRGEKPCD